MATPVLTCVRGKESSCQSLRTWFCNQAPQERYQAPQLLCPSPLGSEDPRTLTSQVAHVRGSSSIQPKSSLHFISRNSPKISVSFMTLFVIVF